MGPAAILLVVLVLVVVLAAAASAVRVVPAGHAGVVERRGRPIRVADPGVVAMLPFVDRLAHRVDLRESALRLRATPVIDADSLVHHVDVTVHHVVRDPRAAAYEVADHRRALEQLVVTTLRHVVGRLPTTEVSGHEPWLGRRLHEVLGEAVGVWGLEVRRVEVAPAAPGGR